METESFTDKLGGRKFLMALLCMGAGVAIEIKGPSGLSANMVALLGALYATFSASNAVITRKQLDTEAAATASIPAAPVATLDSAPAVEAIRQELVPVLNAMGQELGELKSNQLNQAQAMNALQTSLSTVQKGISFLLSK